MLLACFLMFEAEMVVSNVSIFDGPLIIAHFTIIKFETRVNLMQIIEEETHRYRLDFGVDISEDCHGGISGRLLLHFHH